MTAIGMLWCLEGRRPDARAELAHLVRRLADDWGMGIQAVEVSLEEAAASEDGLEVTS